MSISTLPNPFDKKMFGYCVSNGSICKEDPIKELQECIHKKNDKIENYKKNCDECVLLIVLADSKQGSFCHYTNILLEHNYIAKFADIFLYDETKNISYKLNTYQYSIIK